MVIIFFLSFITDPSLGHYIFTYHVNTVVLIISHFFILLPGKCAAHYVKFCRSPLASSEWIFCYQKCIFRLSSLVKSLKNHAFQGRRLPRIKICSWSFGKIFREIWLFIRLKYQKSMIASCFLVFDSRKRAGKLPFLPITAIRQMIFGFHPVRHDKT